MRLEIGKVGESRCYIRTVGMGVRGCLNCILGSWYSRVMLLPRTDKLAWDADPTLPLAHEDTTTSKTSPIIMRKQS